MIDWTKPIETVDGRKALVIGSHPEPRGDPNDEGYFVPRMVWIQSTRNSLFGDVFLVMPSGVRCDDTAWRARPSVPEIREPIIRNAPVKREGWVLKRKFLNLLGDYRVFETEKDAFEASSLSEQLIRIEWEE
jgi:hypothetical protein